MIPFKDVVGNAASVPPAQIAGIGLKTGISGDEMFTFNVVVAVAHWLPAGVNI